MLVFSSIILTVKTFSTTKGIKPEGQKNPNYKQRQPCFECASSFTQLGFPLVLQFESQRLQLLVGLLSQDVKRPPVGLLQSVNLLPLLLLQTLLQRLAAGGGKKRRLKRRYNT